MATTNLTDPVINAATSSRESITVLPPELRMIIFDYAVKASMEESSLGAFPPNLLLAFKGHRKTELYAEALSIYHDLCPRIDYQNEEAFNKIPLRDLLLLKSATFVAPLRFRAQKISCLSNLESIILDFSDFYNEEGEIRGIPGSNGEAVEAAAMEPPHPTSAQNLARNLLGGSRKVRRIELRTGESFLNLREGQFGTAWKVIQDRVGLKYATTPGTGGVTTWVWEAKEGDSALKWVDPW